MVLKWKERERWLREEGRWSGVGRGHIEAWQRGAGSPEVCHGTHHHKLCMGT